MNLIAKSSLTGDDEVGTLAEEFNEMRRNLKTAVDKLTREERKLTAIVDNLGEGLIVVGTHRTCAVRQSCG